MFDSEKRMLVVVLAVQFIERWRGRWMYYGEAGDRTPEVGGWVVEKPKPRLRGKHGKQRHK